MKSNKEFDQIIKEKLQGMEQSPVADSWILLEQKLKAAETISNDVPVEKDPLDQLSYDKLHDFKQPMVAGHWDLFEQQMDAMGQEELTPENDPVDQLSFDKLNNFTQPFNKSHWEMMAGKLEREFYLIQELFRIKTMEVSLLLLLLLTIGRFIPGNTHKTLPVNTATPDMEIVAADKILDSKTAVSENSQLENSLADTETRNGAIKPHSITNPGQSAENEHTAFDQNQVLESADALVLTTPVKEIPVLSLQNLQSLAVGDYLFPAPGVFPLSNFQISPVESLTSRDLGQLKPKGLLSGLKRYFALEKKIRVRTGVYTSLNVNRIINMPTEIGGENIPSLTRYALGHSGGASVGFGMDRFEVETGYAYSSRRYKPIEVQFVGGNVEKGFINESFNLFEFKTITVPLNLRYDIVSQGNWRIYSITGGAVHFTAIANYYVGPSVPSDDNRTQNNLGARNSVIQELERGLVEGLMQGGEIQENAYFSINGGIGFERYVNGKWSLFTQSSYQHTLGYKNEGLGPFKDVAHTFSIAAGVKYRLLGN